MALAPLLRVDQNGLFCEAGGFYVDPWAPVDRAIITHAHADHAAPGSRSYLTTPEGAPLLRARVGEEAAIETLPYGEPRDIGGVRVSLHPSGHILGSAQVRLEHGGEVWVVSGDYKLAPDPTCRPFEPVRCHTFVTEATFGLPIFRWRPEPEVIAGINAWWKASREAGKAALLFAYALGKAQRLLAGIDPAIGPIYTHGAIENVNRIYRAAGVALAPTTHAAEAPPKTDWRGALILAPPSTVGDRLDAPLRRVLHGLRLRLDAHSRRAPPPRARPRLRHLRPRRLARPHARHRRNRRRARARHARLSRPRSPQWLRENGYQAEALETRFADVEEET